MSDTTEPLTRNQALFYLVAMQIEAHPETYDQMYYRSRKWSWRRMRGIQQGCIASWAAVLGGRLRFPPPGSRGWPIVVQPGEAVSAPWREAHRALGLTLEEATILFHKNWEPPAGQTVPEALRAIGTGAPITRSGRP